MILSTSGGSGPNLLRSVAGGGGGGGVGRDNHTSAALRSVRWVGGGVIGRGVQTRCVRPRDGDGEMTRAGTGEGLVIIRKDSLRCRCCCCCCWAGILFSLLSVSSGSVSDMVTDLSGFQTTDTPSSGRTTFLFSRGPPTTAVRRSGVIGTRSKTNGEDLEPASSLLLLSKALLRSSIGDDMRRWLSKLVGVAMTSSTLLYDHFRSRDPATGGGAAPPRLHTKTLTIDKSLVGRKPPPGVCSATTMLIARPPASPPASRPACQPVQPLVGC